MKWIFPGPWWNSPFVEDRRVENLALPEQIPVSLREAGPVSRVTPLGPDHRDNPIGDLLGLDSVEEIEVSGVHKERQPGPPLAVGTVGHGLARLTRRTLLRAHVVGGGERQPLLSSIPEGGVVSGVVI